MEPVIIHDNPVNLVRAAGEELLASAKSASVPLHRVEFVLPLTPTDSSVWAWLFFETDAQLSGSEGERWTAWLKAEFLKILRRSDYPEPWLDEVGFAFDSHENVVRNYEGSYFYRLR